MVQVHRIITKDLGIRELHDKIQNLNVKYTSKMGHFAINCWHRYEPHTQRNISVNHSQFLSTENFDTTSSILRTLSTLHDLWYPHSGASHHITND